jgi:hypothetical protein
VDKGYHNGKQIEISEKANITTIVAQPEESNENGTTKDYLVAHFSTIKTPTYLSAGRNTKTSSWHKKTTDRDSYNFKKIPNPKMQSLPGNIMHQ